MPEPLLTIIVPAYRVLDCLDECLTSILDQAGADIEVVAVDDASPDRCGEILDAWAARDARVRVEHLGVNVGLGPARNAGLKLAAGRFVWFVDSDDVIPDGAIAAVMARLRELEPDVLLIDHVRTHPDGTVAHDAHSRLLRGIDGRFPLADHPELLGLQHTAWSRIVRRDFLAGTGIDFRPGWYEDCAFSAPVLIAAASIAVLDHVCYHYRQGRPGAITATTSLRHFEAFDQYAYAFELLDTLGEAAQPFAPLMFRAMADHYLVIVGNDGRLPRSARRAFFRRASQQLAALCPTGGYPAPGGVAGLKHWLLRHDRYTFYAALRLAHRIRRRRSVAAEATAATVGVRTQNFTPRHRRRTATRR